MKPKICIVQANYYEDISLNLYYGAQKVLSKHDFLPIVTAYPKRLKVVPGVFEIPVTIAKNINSYDAFIALGCIIKGETAHFDLISRAVTNSIMNLSITHKKPIGNGIIACFNKEQAMKRSLRTKKNNKGGEAARAVLSVLGILKDESK